MDILKSDFARKQTLVLLGLGAILLISLFALSSSRSYLYRSRADEIPQTVRKTQNSVAVVSIDVSSHSCVKSLAYLPGDNNLGCFAQIECASKVQGVIPTMCIQDNETLSCTVSERVCLSKDDWTQEAVKVCGCS